MAQVEVSDYALWIKHIHGGEALKRRLEALAPDETVILRIAGDEGMWRKMSAYRTSGRPTPGLSPIGPMQARWGELYRRYKAEGGGLVEIELVSDAVPKSGRKDVPSRWEEAPEAERKAAWEAFKALRNAGWRSEGPYGARDELYDRDDR
jgi:hypothetical protein